MPNHLSTSPGWIVGAGYMGIEYAKVLNALNVPYQVIGRSDASVEKFSAATGKKAVAGGLANFLSTSPDVPPFVIVAVTVTELAATTLELLRYGVKNILIEKPAGLNYDEVGRVAEAIKTNGARGVVAYNRRFYASVLAARKMIEADGGVDSFAFEFTEWAHRIAELDRPAELLQAWFLANSTHVIDMAFFLGGRPA